MGGHPQIPSSQYVAKITGSTMSQAYCQYYLVGKYYSCKSVNKGEGGFKIKNLSTYFVNYPCTIRSFSSFLYIHYYDETAPKTTFILLLSG